MAEASATEGWLESLEPARTRLRWIGFAGLAATSVLALGWTDEMLQSYLVAYLFWANVAIGCLPILMLQYLTGGAWGMVLRRILEAGSRTLPVIVILFLPIALGMEHLFLWADPKAVSGDVILQHKSPYLNVPFFYARAVFYFAAWGGLVWILNRWSAELDSGDGASAARRLELVSGPGIVLYALAMTFASFDWVMSLDPHWFSHIFGPLFGIGQILGAFTFGIVMLVILSARPPLADVVRPDVLQDLGKLLLAFVMVWAYFSFSQLLIIWAGNLPEEITWYLDRMYGGWRGMGVALIVLHFALPFMLLLSRTLKRNPRTLRWVAIGVLGMRFVDLFWLVTPSFGHGGHPPGLGLHLTFSIVAMVGIGGIWTSLFLGQLRARPLLPMGDPYLEETLGHAES